MTGDPQSAILVYLRDRFPNGSTIKILSEATGFSPTAVRNNLRVMETNQGRGNPWVKSSRLPGIKGHIYSLTDDGRRVASYRRTNV